LPEDIGTPEPSEKDSPEFAGFPNLIDACRRVAQEARAAQRPQGSGRRISSPSRVLTHLNTNKKRQLSALFALNRRMMKAYLLKESLDRLWSYTNEAAMLRYLQSRIDQLRWQRLKPMEKLARMLLNHLEGLLNHCGSRYRWEWWKRSMETSKGYCVVVAATAMSTTCC
jgi:hypothetical protein